MRIYKGFLSAATLEAIDKLKAGEIKLTMPGSAIASGMTADQYKTALLTVLNSISSSDDNASWREDLPSEVTTLLANYAASVQVWLRHKEEVSMDDVVSAKVLAIYNHLVASYVNEPNSNISDVQAGQALYTGLVITGSQKLDHDGKREDAAIASKARKVYGDGIKVQNDSIISLPKNMNAREQAERYDVYTAGSLKDADFIGEELRSEYQAELQGPMTDAAIIKVKANSVYGHAILLGSTGSPSAPETPLPTHNATDSDEWIAFDEISSDDSVLWANNLLADREPTSSVVVVNSLEDNVTIDGYCDFGRIVTTALKWASDHYIYKVGLNLLLKQEQVQQSLDARDQSANGGSSLFSLKWLWILLLALILLIILIYVLSKDKDKDSEPKSVVNINLSANGQRANNDTAPPTGVVDQGELTL